MCAVVNDSMGQKGVLACMPANLEDSDVKVGNRVSGPAVCSIFAVSGQQVVKRQ